METNLSAHNLSELQNLINSNSLAVDESRLIGSVTFDDGTEMEIMLQGTEDGTFLQGVILGLGNDETDDVYDTLDVEGYRARLVSNTSNLTGG